MAAAAGYTADDLVEVLGDFPTFCSLLDIRLKTGGSKTFHFEDWREEQQRFERDRTGWDLVLKARQIGMTTLELARDLWFSIVYPGAQVLVIVHDGKLADQLFVTLRLFSDSLRQIGLLPRTRYSNKREIVFAETGGAVRIDEAGETERAAEKKGRSGTIHRLHATEVAFWGAAAETMAAVLSAVPDDGEVVIESTPNGVGGVFYDAVQQARSGQSKYRLHFYPWWQHAAYRRRVPKGFDPRPRDEWEQRLRAYGCDDAQIAWWRSKVDDPNIGLEQALQEFPIDIDTCFRASGNAWLEAAVVDELAKHVREPKRLAPMFWPGKQVKDPSGIVQLFAPCRFEPARVYENPVRGRRYVVFGDVAEGVAGDASAAVVLDTVTGAMVATWWSDAVEPGNFGTLLAILGYLYNTALVAPERNNHGAATLERLITVMGYPNLYHHTDGRPGWPTNAATRPVMFDELGQAIREGVAIAPDADVVAECRTLIRDEDGKPRARGKRTKAKDACRDDRFVAWAGAWQLRSSNTWTGRGFTFKGA